MSTQVPNDPKSSLNLANRLATARPAGAAPAAGAPVTAPVDHAVLQSVVTHSNDINSLKTDLNAAKSEIATHKAKLADLENCILQLDSSLSNLQQNNLASLASKVQSNSDSQSALADRVAKVESLHSKLSSALSS